MGSSEIRQDTVFDIDFIYFISTIHAVALYCTMSFCWEAGL